MASTYNKINLFVADLANKAHNLGSDQLAVALTDTAPTTGQAGAAGTLSGGGGGGAGGGVGVCGAGGAGGPGSQFPAFS